MEQLHRIITAYEKMDLRRRRQALIKLEQDAEIYPMVPLTQLRLIRGGGLGGPGRIGGGSHDVFARLVVGGTIVKIK